MDKLFEINDYELLSKKVYRILKAGIIKGDLAQGGKLFEAKIAEQLGISRTPVREALRELAAEGFVTMTPNLGVKVVDKASIKDIREVLQIRGVLEGLAARLVATQIKKEEIMELKKIVEGMNRYAREKNIFAFSGCSSKFQELILDISGNSQLIKMRKNICDKAHRYRIISLSSPKRLKYSFEEHRDIFEAIRKKDPEKAEKLSQIHTENVYKNILAHIEKNGDEKL